jgi:uncharacterized Zn ribbon protein
VAGTAYARFIDGDRKGSICRLVLDNGIGERPSIERSWRSWDRDITHEIKGTHIGCRAEWDGRRNKTRFSIPHYEAEVLLDYEGPTVWEKFDAKTAKEELLKNPNQKDINGNVLAIGDKVLYINARYGSRMVLEEGSIAEFAASVNSKGHTIATIIESQNGEMSSLSYPEDMVYLMP